MTVKLPPFPVDDVTLDLLMAAIDPPTIGDTVAESSDLYGFLDHMSRMGGADPDAVEEVIQEADPDATGSWMAGASIVMMRDESYEEHAVITALVEEIRRLRRQLVKVVSS